MFTRSGSTWTQQGEKLTGSGETGEGHFGFSVALSEDGNTALIGGPGDNTGVGAAWVFTRSGSTWTQQGSKLTGTGETGEGAFGFGVALSADGNTALIGGPGDNSGVGAAWVFTRSGSTWTQQGSKLTATGEIGNGRFGGGVALSANGNTALIGGEGDSTLVGAAWVFRRSGSTWTQGSKLTGSGETGGGKFGGSVALSSDASTSTALIGGYGDNSEVGAAWVFVAFVGPPTVVTGAASAVTQTSATLNATVNPNGAAVSDCKFEYGTTTAYGSSAPCASLPGSGESPVAVSASVTGLTANTTYHFRISATNAAARAKAQTKRSRRCPNPPTVVTEAASAVTQTTATLNATVNPNGGEVSECKFEYGTTTAYGSSAPCSSLPGSGTSPVAVSASVTGLAANTTYHFRISATNAGGTSKGSDQTFKTLPSPPTVVTGAASAVTQTSATLNATVNPNGGEVSECKFEYGTTTAYGSSAACTPSPGSGTSPVAVSASVTGLTREHHLPLQDLRDQRGRHEQRLRPDVQNAAQRPDGRDRSGVGGHADHGDPERDGEPQRRDGQRLQVRIRHHDRLRVNRAVRRPRRGRGAARSRCPRRSRAWRANTTYHFRISATNAGGTSKGSDETFKTLPNAPTVVTGAASAVTQTSATLNATVNPNGGTVSECKFEYGTTTGYGSTASCSSLPGSGTSPVAVSASVTGLTANTTYHFRISATNAGGTSKGSDETFKTLPNAPTVVTGAASAVTQTSATLNATVNPNGGEVSECKFEYGTTTAYGSSAPCTPSPGSGTSPVAVSASVTGLTANTTYHFRISATNAGGTSKGSDETFKTLPNPPTVVTEAASSVTQTSATLNATVNPNGGEVSECKLEYGTTNAYGIERAVHALAGVRDQPGRGVRVGHGPDREHHLPLPDLRDQPGRHEQRLRRNVQNAAEPPDGRDRSGVRGHADLGDAERDGEPQRRGSQRMQARIRHHERLRAKRAVHALAGVRHQPGPGVRLGHGPYREHDLPLPDLRDQRGRHEQRLRRNVQNAAEPADGRDRSGVLGHPDHGDAERDGQPQRRGSQRMQVRIRHHERLRVKRAVLLAAGIRGRARSRSRRRSRA